MNEKFTLTGGAKIGWANATYPLANLYVDKEVLKINASIVGNLVFQPQDIISIKPHTFLFSRGIKINHRVEKYKSEVIFWTFENPNSVISKIEKTGFLQNTNSKTSVENLEIIKKQNEGGFPLKKSVAIFFVIAWNLLFLSDIISFFLNGSTEGFPLGIGMNLALGLLFASSILMIVSEKFRKIVLKENRNFDDIKKFVYFTAFISGIMFLMFVTI